MYPLECSSGNNPPNISKGESVMDSIVYLVGLVVIIMAILSFLGIH